jgi:hypothetical protein
MPVTLNFPVEPSERIPKHNPFFEQNGYCGINIKDKDKDKLKHTKCVNKTCAPYYRFGNGFIDAVIQAYNYHKNLEVSPDGLWMTILTSLMTYVENNAESLRSHFVAHDGKKELEIELDGSYNTLNATQFAELMMHKINENVKDPATKEWLQCNFSTTTEKERTASTFLIMAGLQKYFAYLMRFSCGIPQVTILGERADYVLIKEKVRRIGEINDATLQDWSKRLLPIIDQFILSFDNATDASHEVFWSTIVTSEGYGSGGRDYITGWLATLCPFVKERDNRENPDQMFYRPDKIEMAYIPVGFMNVPIHVNDNGHEFDVTVYVGQFGYEYKNDTFSTTINYLIGELGAPQGP